MASLLITGGAGFIGVNFVYYWLAHHPADRIVALDVLTYAGNRNSLNRAETNSNFRFVHGNICDRSLLETLMTQEKIDTIVHFAAESHVDRSIADPESFVTTNIVGTYSMLEAARTVWLNSGSCVRKHRFHHISTDEVYGSLEVDGDSFSETTRYAPRSPYAASKASSDHLVRAYHHTYGLQTSISNCSNNYGPYQFPEKLIPLTILNALHGESLPVYGDGQNVRDWLFVDDHCRAIDLILCAGVPGETYNIGGNAEMRNIDVVERICHQLDEAFRSEEKLRTRFPEGGRLKCCKDLIQYVTDRPGHDRRYAVDATKISQTLGFSPETSFEDGIDRTLNWYLGNQPWWEAIMDHSYRNWIAKNYATRG